jgi:protein-disulfide isomerase
VLEIEERDHALGPEDAEITLLEYGDFECPHCGAAYRVVKQLQEELGESMRLVFREFPLMNVHEHAEAAAEAAEAAGAQGRFWQMHDFLFENQREMSPHLLKVAAIELDLDMRRYLDELERHAHSVRVRQDMRTGMAAGVHGTPTFFINGIRHEGAYDFETLMRAIDAHRRQAAA